MIKYGNLLTCAQFTYHSCQVWFYWLRTMKITGSIYPNKVILSYWISTGIQAGHLYILSWIANYNKSRIQTRGFTLDFETDYQVHVKSIHSKGHHQGQRTTQI